MLDELTHSCVKSRMLDHKAIKAQREELGWSQAKLAEMARKLMPVPDPKLAQQTVNRIEKGSNSKYKNFILAALRLPSVPPLTIERRPAAPIASDVEVDLTAPSFRSQTGRLRDVEEVGIAVGGEDGDFEMNGEVVSMVPRPPALVGRDIFAVRVKNDSMSPRFEEGDLLYAERKREPAIGDDAIIELWPDDTDGAGHAFIKRVVSKNMHSITVMQFNPEKQITFRRDEIQRLFRVVPRNEMFGV